MTKIMAMLLSPEERQSVPMGKEQWEAFEARRKAYRDAMTLERHAWIRDMSAKHRLQQAAIKALPERLRKLAVEPDLTPCPLNRNFLFHTPPEAYRD